MVCVMAQGKIVVLDTAAEIKREYGIGYTLVVERLVSAGNEDESNFESEVDALVL